MSTDLQEKKSGALTLTQQHTKLVQWVEARQAQLDKAMPAVVRSYLTPTEIIERLSVAISDNPELLQCTERSIMKGLIRSAQTGLDISGRGGQAWLIPFFNRDKGVHEAQFVAGYKGLRLNLYRHQIVSVVEDAVVWDEDDFSYRLGLEPELKHLPSCPGYENPKTAWEHIEAAYAIARLTNGQTLFAVVPKPMLARIRSNAPGGDATIARKWPEQWCRKTAIKQLAGKLPAEQGALIQATIEADNAVFEEAEGNAALPEGVEPEEPDLGEEILAELQAGMAEAEATATETAEPEPERRNLPAKVEAPAEPEDAPQGEPDGADEPEKRDYAYEAGLLAETLDLTRSQQAACEKLQIGTEHELRAKLRDDPRAILRCKGIGEARLEQLAEAVGVDPAELNGALSVTDEPEPEPEPKPEPEPAAEPEPDNSGPATPAELAAELAEGTDIAGAEETLLTICQSQNLATKRDFAEWARSSRHPLTAYLGVELAEDVMDQVQIELLAEPENGGLPAIDDPYSAYSLDKLEAGNPRDFEFARRQCGCLDTPTDELTKAGRIQLRKAFEAIVEEEAGNN